MAKITALEPDPIQYVTEERYAVFLIEDMEGKKTHCLGVFNTPREAREFIEENHRKGNVYFIAEGYCMG